MKSRSRGRRPPTARRARRGSPRSRRARERRARRAARASSPATSTSVQPRFGATSRRPSLSTRPGSAIDRAGDERARCSPRAASDVLGQPGEVVEHRVDRPAAVVALDAGAVALGAAQVDGADGEEVDADLEPEPDDPLRPSSSTGSAGRPTVPRSSTSVSRTSPNVDQLADEAGDRRLVEPGLLRDRRARARAALARRGAAPRRGCAAGPSAGWRERGAGRAGPRRHLNGPFTRPRVRFHRATFVECI